MIRVCDVDEVPEGEGRHFLRGAYDLAVFNLSGSYYVTDDTCTHGPSSLADGFIDADVVECPFHFGKFHIPTGQPRKYPCTIALRTYVTKVIGNELFIQIG